MECGQYNDCFSYTQLMQKSVRVALCLLALAISTPLAAKPELSQATAAHVRPATALAAKMAVAADKVVPANTLMLRVDTPDGPLDLLLTPATLMQTQAASKVSAIRDGRTRLYRGIVAGQPASWVRLTLIDEAWLGAIQVDDKLWLLDPARQHPQLANRLGLGKQDSLVFTLDDFQGLGPIDHGGVLPPPGALVNIAAPADRNASTRRTSGNQYYLGVSLVLDTEFQSHYGTSAQSTAVGILNTVAGFYSAQANIEVYLYDLKSLTSNGSLVSTNPNTLLDTFQVWLRSSPVPFSGVAHLLSGKNFDGSTVGMAWLGSVCDSSYGSGVNEVTYSAAASGAILAHEMGHNFDMRHDGIDNSCPISGFIMNAVSILNSPPTEFSTCSMDYLSSYLTPSAPACLQVPPPGEIFAHGFE